MGGYAQNTLGHPNCPNTSADLVNTKRQHAEETNEAQKEEEEDSPIVKQLKTLDDQYLAIEREYEKEVGKLRVCHTRALESILCDADQDTPKNTAPNICTTDQ
eukprot:2197756-Amphidinium_carterae.1